MIIVLCDVGAWSRMGDLVSLLAIMHHDRRSSESLSFEFETKHCTRPSMSDKAPTAECHHQCGVYAAKFVVSINSMKHLSDTREVFVLGRWRPRRWIRAGVRC